MRCTMMVVCGMGLMLGVVGGCEGPKREPVTMQLEDVPPELMKIAQQKLPGIKFDSVFKKASGTIEIRGKDKNGKIREVDLRADGTVLEVE